MITLEPVAQMFAAIDDEGRRFVMVMLQFEYDRVQKLRRPALRLIRGGPPPVPSTKTRSSTRTKKKEPA
jgi:hypothetical protein